MGKSITLQLKLNLDGEAQNVIGSIEVISLWPPFPA